MEPAERVLESYIDSQGRCPFDEWLQSLKDKKARAIVRTRLGRLRLGNTGECDPVGEGVLELKIHYGPGYRIYFGQAGPKVVILLCGGEKSSQSSDIRTAIEYWRDYKK